MKKIHSHIGAGSDPTYWLKSAEYLLTLIEKQFPDVEVLNLGGGFKVARGDLDKATDVHALAPHALKMLEDFNKRTGRRIRAEIEPGSFLVANAGILISEVIDVTSTKHNESDSEGHNFIKLNTGLNELTRPALYGAQHSIKFLSFKEDAKPEEKPYVVVGHCCESGDLLTCQPGNADDLREISASVSIGDFAVIRGTGAYCSAMSLKNYNSFPEAAEVMIMLDGKTVRVIRQRQGFEQIMQNEVDIIKL